MSIFNMKYLKQIIGLVSCSLLISACEQKNNLEHEKTLVVAKTLCDMFGDVPGQFAYLYIKTYGVSKNDCHIISVQGWPTDPSVAAKKEPFDHYQLKAIAITGSALKPLEPIEVTTSGKTHKTEAKVTMLTEYLCYVEFDLPCQILQEDNTLGVEMKFSKGEEKFYWRFFMLDKYALAMFLDVEEN